MDILQTFKDLIVAFLREQNMAPTTFGTQAMRDSNFIQDLHEGREPHISTIMKVERWMNDYRAQKQREKQSADEAAE